MEILNTTFIAIDCFKKIWHVIYNIYKHYNHAHHIFNLIKLGIAPKGAKRGVLYL